ncbi:hypothetical protein FACS1894205_6480 [Alphaproteobacteria bacterium]|nr:hypothetical protein FACS1894205_6480 [Alphaproteobacteria bacterium]
MRFATLISICGRSSLALLAGGVIALAVLALQGGAASHSPNGDFAVSVAKRAAGSSSSVASAAIIDEEEIKSAQALNAAFDRIGFDLGLVAVGDRAVPRIILDALPKDIHEVQTSNERKALFLRALLPIVLDVNDRILEERTKLGVLRTKVIEGASLTGDDVLWLLQLSEAYDQPDADLDALVKKVDIVPNSLALAQAIEESGWGTSRIAREMNALYGQVSDGWGYRSFSDLFGAVEAYARNLNTHRAYREFRSNRAAMRATEDGMDASELAGTLHRYSERGQAYVRAIRRIMRDNQLSNYDEARLNEPYSETSPSFFSLIR